MDSQDILHGFIHIWDQIPGLLGERLADFFPELEKLFIQIEATEIEGERDSLTADLTRLVWPYSELRRALKTQVDHFGYEEQVRQNQEITPTPPWWHNWAKLIPGLRRCFDPPSEIRYAGIRAPGAMGQHEIQTIEVHLRISPKDPVSFPIEALPGQFLEVVLHADEEDFEVFENSAQKLYVEPAKDAGPVVFRIKSLSLGRKICYLDFRQNRESLAFIPVVIEIFQTGTSNEQHLEAEIETGGGYVLPADLELQVVTRTKNGKTKIDYVLNSALEGVGYQKRIKGPTLRGDVAALLSGLLKKVEGIKLILEPDGRPRSLAQTHRDLEAVGHQLYDELFNDAMRQAYRGFREKIRTMVISSNEPWIPWELVKPYETVEDEIIDDDFWCNQFQTTRWFAGDRPPVRKISLNRFALVAAGQAAKAVVLPEAFSEEEVLSRVFINEGGLEDNSPAPASPKKILQLLERGGIELWHFSSHGDHSNLVLDRGRLFRPQDLHGKLLHQISQDRPFVFFNGCETAKLNTGLVHLSGWPVTWITKGRCSAFVGSMWKIADRQGYEFAKAFYQALLKGATIGQAASKARTHARDSGRAIHDPTWAAFAVYAHPNAKVEFPRQKLNNISHN